MRKLFYLFNALLLASFLVALYIDHDTEWRKYQKEFFRAQSAKLEERAASAKSPEEAKALRDQAKGLRDQPVMIRQIIVKDLDAVDRCITCHVGMDEFANPTLKTDLKEQPFTGHPDLKGVVKDHPFQKFACTSCHAGQGLATTAKAAHGDVENWEKPLLKGSLIQASCARCHANFETLKGAETVAMGRKLMENHGCMGCHQINRVGGVISVDLGDIADKPLERVAPYNFSLIQKDGKPLPKEEWKLQAWIEAHLTNVPMDFVPNDPFAKYNKEPIAPSGMPDFTRELPKGGADAITAYLLSLSHEPIPSTYFVAAAPKPEPRFGSAVEHGRFVFKKYGCAGCHGVDAKEGRRNYNALGPGQPELASVAGDEGKLHEAMSLGREPTLPETVGTYTREELRAKIQNGVPGSAIVKYNPDGPVPPLYMPPWKDKIKGAELEDLLTYLMSIAKKDDLGF